MRQRAVLSAVVAVALWSGGAASAQGVKAAGETAAAPAAGKTRRDKKRPARRAKVPARKPKASESRYKSRALSQNTVTHYRFDSNGDPVQAPAKKAKTGSRSKSAADSANAPVSPAGPAKTCSPEETCSDPGADAL